MNKDLPLWHRIYFDACFTTVCRLIGYGGCLYPQLWDKLKPAAEAYGQRRVESATAHLLTYEQQFSVNPPPLAKVELRANVRKLCFQLLGPEPDQWEEFHKNGTNPPPNPYRKPVPKKV